MANKYNSSTKANILRKIDDAASEIGSARPSQLRDIGAKSTAKNVLNNNMNKALDRPFAKSDLDRLNQLAETGKKEPSEAGRSLKSEYDYGSKRKFVDVLGNVNKKNTFNLQKMDPKNEELKSVRSKYSEINKQQSHGYKD